MTTGTSEYCQQAEVSLDSNRLNQGSVTLAAFAAGRTVRDKPARCKTSRAEPGERGWVSSVGRVEGATFLCRGRKTGPM